MIWFFYIIIFLGSCVVLSWLSSRLIKSLVSIAQYLGWREFIVAFFVMAFAASLPNLFIDLNAALQGIPELAFGDIIGGNLIDLTFVLAIAVFFSKKGLSADSDMVQKSAVFTTVIAILPLILIWDGRLDRIDGVVLIGAFGVYLTWLFSKKDRFIKKYQTNSALPAPGFKVFLANVAKIILLLALLLAASQAVISSARYFSSTLGISLSLVGILIVGLGNCFPELYFSIISARQEKNWLVLGDLMGSVIVCSTLILGIIALVAPFEIPDFSPFLIARMFLILATILSLVFIKTGKKITKKEGLALLLVYIIFLIVEIFLK